MKDQDSERFQNGSNRKPQVKSLKSKDKKGILKYLEKFGEVAEHMCVREVQVRQEGGLVITTAPGGRGEEREIGAVGGGNESSHGSYIVECLSHQQTLVRGGRGALMHTHKVYQQRERDTNLREVTKSAKEKKLSE